MAYNTDGKQTVLPFMKPIETRRLTDKFALLLVPISLLFWFGVGIYELFYGHDRDIFKNLLSYFPKSQIYGLITVTIIIVLLVVLNFLIDHWLIFIARFSIAVSVFITTVFLLWNVFCLFHSQLISLLITIIIMIVLIYNLSILICIKELGASFLGPLIKDPIRSIMRSLTLLLFSLAIIFLLMIVFSISLPIAEKVYSSTYSYTGRWLLENLISFTFTLASIYIFIFIWNLGFTIMSDYFAHYYGSGNFSRTNIFQSIGKVLRYHIGTIAFLSTPILPSLCTLIMLFENKKQTIKQSENKLVNFISKISLIMDIPEYALIQTSVHGTESLKSIRRMVDLHHSNPLLFLTLNAVTVKILDLIKILTILIGWFGVELYVLGTHNLFGSTFSLQKFGIGVGFAYLVNTLFWRPAVCTFTIYKMSRDQHESNTSSEQTELMLNPL